MLDAIADNADMLVKGDDSGFMNRVSLAVRGKSAEADTPAPQKPKKQSHIRQARPSKPAVNIPEDGPMAAMLKKLLGDKN